MGQRDSASVLTRAKVWKMREYWMYFPFFILHDWGKKSAEARCSHLSGVALIRREPVSHRFAVFFILKNGTGSGIIVKIV